MYVWPLNKTSLLLSLAKCMANGITKMENIAEFSLYEFLKYSKPIEMYISIVQTVIFQKCFLFLVINCFYANIVHYNLLHLQRTLNNTKDMFKYNVFHFLLF